MQHEKPARRNTGRAQNIAEGERKISQMLMSARRFDKLKLKILTDVKWGVVNL